MTSIDLHVLLRKLEPAASAALERAAGLAVARGHEAIEIAHWLAEIAREADAIECFEAAATSADAVAAQAMTAVDEQRPGRGGAPAFASNTVLLARESWTVATLQYGRERVGCGDVLAALLDEPSLRAVARGIAPALRDADRHALDEHLKARAAPAEGGAAPPSAPGAGAPAGGEDFLQAYTSDLTAQAREGAIDPVIGRDRELRQVVDILMRRRQNNPILVGEAGVGKTAIAEAFALAIAEGDVPERLRGVSLLSLDLSLLQAGAGVKGEFERRLKGVVDQVRASPEPIVLFIDEAHQLIGAGGQAGQGDAANILKPSLARGELRTVAATTWSEYKKYVETDPALTRRFQTVKVDEPDVETAVRMLRGLAPAFTRHHGVRIRDEALRAAVELSARYIPARQLPDKAVSLIDTAGAAVALGREVEPVPLGDVTREIAQLEAERVRLRDEPSSERIARRLAAIETALDGHRAELERLHERLRAEEALLDRADELEQRLGEDDTAAAELEDVEAELEEVEAELAALQGESPLMHRVVDREAVAQLVARWTGVPVGRLLRDQVRTVATLEDRLRERIVGQDAALATVSAAMRVARAGLADPNRPPGVFLFVGTSGVGKTETALALADLVYGGESSLTVINMSEFKEEHKVSMLLGSPPGYVGYGEGGVLTEAVRRRPYGVLLLDEIDKAHPGVQDVFYQLFDKGSLRDGEGRDIDFKNTTILMTANTGTQTLARLALDPETMPEGEALEAALHPELLEQFKPAFLGRATTVPFLPLGAETLGLIVDLQVARITARVAATYEARFALAPAARDALVASAQSSDAGARAIQTKLARDVLPVVSTFLLDAVADGRRVASVTLDVADGAFVARGEDRADETTDTAPEPSAAAPSASEAAPAVPEATS